jgi:L-asparaginase II
VSDAELVHVTRGGAIDCVHRGHVVVVDSQGGVLFQRGKINSLVFMRSLAKPFQAMAVVESGAAKKFDFTSAELALMCGSHNGTSEQTQILEGVMQKIGVQIGDLQCGKSTPIDRKTSEQLVLNGQKPTALHHPCSGKHIGMLAICKAKDWEIEGYTHAHHAVQKYITDIVYTALMIDDFVTTLALDGCSVPTYGVPLSSVAIGFKNIGMRMLWDEDSAHKTIGRAMQEHPVLMSGQRRMDTALMLATNGRVIAKDGTEGIFGCAIPDRGVGLALKISDGSSRAIMPVVTKVLRDLDYISAEEAEKLTAQFPLDIKIHTGEKAGEMRVVF